jgi:hypothetical protein
MEPDMDKCRRNSPTSGREGQGDQLDTASQCSIGGGGGRDDNGSASKPSHGLDDIVDDHRYAIPIASLHVGFFSAEEALLPAFSSSDDFYEGTTLLAESKDNDQLDVDTAAVQDNEEIIYVDSIDWDSDEEEEKETFSRASLVHPLA